MTGLLNSITSTVYSITNNINPAYQNHVYASVCATGTAIIAACAPWETTKIIGLTTLMSIGYRTAHNMITARDNIEFLKVKTQHGGREFVLTTLNPNLNAIVWGMGKFPRYVTASVFLAVLARTSFPGLSKKIAATEVIPSAAFVAILAFAYTHFKSRKEQQKIEKKGSCARYEHVEQTPQAQGKWKACRVRNQTGDAALASGAIVLAVAMLVARAGFIHLPTFSSILNCKINFFG